MTDDLDARIRERLDRDYHGASKGELWQCGAEYAQALRAVLGLHTMGNLASDCDCYDGLTECPTVRALADALGIGVDGGET